MSRILIIGGHGKVARLLTPLLAARGDEVTAIIRNPDHASDVEGDGATAVVADVAGSDVAALAALFAGHDAIVWSAGAGGGDADRTYAIDRDAAIRSMDAAAAAGVRRYVMVSYFGAGPDHGITPENSFFAYAEAKAAADEYLRGTGLAWTILGPGHLTSGPGNCLIDVNPYPTWQGAYTSRANVAIVAAAVLEVPGSPGKTIEFRDGTLPVAAALEAVK